MSIHTIFWNALKGDLEAFKKSITENLEVINQPCFFDETLFEALCDRVINSTDDDHISNANQAIAMVLSSATPDISKVYPQAKMMLEKNSFNESNLQKIIAASLLKRDLDPKIVPGLYVALQNLQLRNKQLSTLIEHFEKYSKTQQIALPKIEESSLSQQGLEIEVFDVINKFLIAGNTTALEQMIEIGLIDVNGTTCYPDRNHRCTWLQVFLDKLKTSDYFQSMGIHRNDQAEYANYLKCLEVLIKHGANPAAITEGGDTALVQWQGVLQKSLTISKSLNTSLEELQVAASGDTFAPLQNSSFPEVDIGSNSKDKTPRDETEIETVELLMAKGELEPVQQLLQKQQISANFRLRYGRTLLQSAAFNHCVEAIPLLIKYGADPRLTSNFEMDKGANAIELLRAEIIKQEMTQTPIRERQLKVLRILYNAPALEASFKMEAEQQQSPKDEAYQQIASAEKVIKFYRDIASSTNSQNPEKRLGQLIDEVTSFGQKISEPVAQQKTQTPSKSLLTLKTSTGSKTDSRTQLLTSKQHLQTLPELTLGQKFFASLIDFVLHIFDSLKSKKTAPAPKELVTKQDDKSKSIKSSYTRGYKETFHRSPKPSTTPKDDTNKSDSNVRKTFPS